MKRWLAIVNQAAGRKPTDPARVRNALDAAGVEADLVVPHSTEEVAEIINDEVDSGREHIASVGGDGTVNLVVNHLMRRNAAHVVLGVLPAGTGCDLLRTFGISQVLEEAARHLATDEVYPVDVVQMSGNFGERHYVNVAQVGVGAAAAETAPKLRRGLGQVRYPIAFLGRLPRFPVATVSITTERRTYESDALAVIMANAQFFAGGWNVAPKATLVDGVADIQIINTPKTRAPMLVPKIIKGTHLTDRAVRRFSAAEFRIETSVIWPVEADGDLVGNTPIDGRVLPAALQLKI